MKDTYTLTFEACGRYFADTGKIPTVEAMKAVIGRKSPSVISAAIKAWKTELAQTINDRQAGLTGIPPELNDAFIAIWQVAMEAATNVYREQTEALEGRESDLATLQHEFNTERGRIEQLAETTAQHYREEIDYLKKSIDRLTHDNSSLKAETCELRETAAQADRQSVIYCEQLRQEQDKYQRLDRQFNQQNAWSLQRIQEEKELFRQQTQQEMKRLTNEATRNKQDLALLQAKIDLLVQQVLTGQNRIIELEQALAAVQINQAYQHDQTIRHSNSFKRRLAKSSIDILATRPKGR